TARIRNLIDSYPGMEGLFIGIPEGFYEDPYNESRDYIEGQMVGFSEALRLQKKFWGAHWPGDELQRKHIEADIAFSKIAADALEIAHMEKPGLKLGLITVCKAYLLTKLHEILPQDVAFCDIESRSLWTHDGAPLFLFRKMKGRECSIIPRITDDGSQAGMQFNLNLYFKDGYCRSVLENGTLGMMMQTLYIKGADHNIKYLADGLWNPLITPDWFYSSYIEKVYGKKSIRKLKKAYDVLEDNEIFMGGRGAANMPWNHVPPEIAILRSLQNSKNPYNECPLEYSFIKNSESRAAVYTKTSGTLDKIAGIFADARPNCNSYGKEESLYMERRTRAYSWHLKALIQLSALYSLYKAEFEKNDDQRKLADILVKAEAANFAAKESAILFSKCVVHTTDLAPLWMVNSSMVKGTEILLQFINNLISYHKGLGNLQPVRWDQLFGECPYPAHGISNRPESDAPHAYEPG
ncbi:MAG: hypothetical protein R3232_07755, partial [Clostridia bacterium]|nr:hypothetical protein [Clostridia bacterium]